MKCIAILAGLGLYVAVAGTALADIRYDIAAIDDVNGYATFSGSITTTAPFSLDYNFSVVDFDLHYLTKSVTYSLLNSTVEIEAQGFLFKANDASSSFELTFYPDGSYYSDYFVSGQNTYGDSGYFAFAAAPVPEPASVALLLAGLGLVGLHAHRRQRALSGASPRQGAPL